MSAVSRLEVETLGEGPALVLVHGAGGSPRSSFPFLDELAEQHTLIAPYLPGCGGTPLGEEPLTTRGIAGQIAAYVADRGVTEYAVVGYSMGSTIAIELAAAHPENVSAVALTAGFVKARASLLSFVELWDHLQQGPEDVLGRAILAAVLKPETLDARGPGWIEDSCRATARGLEPGTRSHLELIRSLDVSDALAATSQPLLVLRTEHDRLVDPAHSDDIARIRPDALQVPLDAGHAVGEEDARTWCATLRWFLDRSLHRC